MMNTCVTKLLFTRLFSSTTRRSGDRCAGLIVGRKVTRIINDQTVLVIANGLDNGSHYNPNVVILRRRFPLLLRINVDVFIVEATSGGTHHGLESFSVLTRLFKQDVNPALIHREFHVSLCQEHPYQVDNIENVNNNNHQHAKLAFHSQSRWGMQPSAKHQYPLKILQFLTLQFPRET